LRINRQLTTSNNDNNLCESNNNINNTANNFNTNNIHNNQINSNSCSINQDSKNLMNVDFNNLNIDSIKNIDSNKNLNDEIKFIIEKIKLCSSFTDVELLLKDFLINFTNKLNSNSAEAIKSETSELSFQIYKLNKEKENSEKEYLIYKSTILNLFNRIRVFYF